MSKPGIKIESCRVTPVLNCCYPCGGPHGCFPCSLKLHKDTFFIYKGLSPRQPLQLELIFFLLFLKREVHCLEFLLVAEGIITYHT